MYLDSVMTGIATYREVPLDATSQPGTLLARVGNIPLSPADDYVVRVFFSPASEATGQGVYTKPFTVDFGYIEDENGAASVDSVPPEEGYPDPTRLTSFTLNSSETAGGAMYEGECTTRTTPSGTSYSYCPAYFERTPFGTHPPYASGSPAWGFLTVGEWYYWDWQPSNVEYSPYDQGSFQSQAAHDSVIFTGLASKSKITVSLSEIDAHYVMSCDSKDPNEGDPNGYTNPQPGEPPDAYQWFWYCAASGTWGKVFVWIDDLTTGSLVDWREIWSTDAVNIKSCAFGACEWGGDETTLGGMVPDPVTFEEPTVWGHQYRVQIGGQAVTPMPDAGQNRYIDYFNYEVGSVQLCWPECA
jgi:hypothetical protein